MKRLLSVVAVAFVVAAGVRAFAQAQPTGLPTVDQVLEKFVTAIGGKAAIEKHTSRVSTGTAESPGGPISGTVVVSEKAPNKTLTVITIPNIGVIRDGFDGTVGWQDDPASGIREKTGKDLVDAKRDAVFNSELKVRELYKTIVVASREAVGGKPAYLLIATPDEGTARRYWFDADSGLLVRTRSTNDTPMGPIDIDVFLEDYRDVGGVKSPFTIRQVTPQFTMIFKLTEIKFDVALDDAIFKKPEKAPESR